MAKVQFFITFNHKLGTYMILLICMKLKDDVCILLVWNIFTGTDSDLLVRCRQPFSLNLCYCHLEMQSKLFVFL